MSLRDHLIKPLSVGPVEPHTHTVIFLHRFPADTSNDELQDNVLSAKMTKNHKTLGDQFPSVLWVFPYAKDHARPWSNLSAEDNTALELSGSLPYITQMIIKEAEIVGGLDKIVLGGQGEAAEAAHEAMCSFPEMPAANMEQPDAIAAFLQQNFHTPWTHISQLKLSGFVGMHAANGHPTRDVRNYGIMSKMGEGPVKVNNAIVVNTPHRFIMGGYKARTATWDGRRIDEFADFLATLGITRTNYELQSQPSEMDLPFRVRSSPAKKVDHSEDELNARQKYMQEITEQKEAERKDRERILRRIEENKVERKIKQAREREARQHRQQ